MFSTTRFWDNSYGAIVADRTTRKIGCKLPRLKKEREHVDFGVPDAFAVLTKKLNFFSCKYNKHK